MVDRQNVCISVERCPHGFHLISVRANPADEGKGVVLNRIKCRCGKYVEVVFVEVDAERAVEAIQDAAALTAASRKAPKEDADGR